MRKAGNERIIRAPHSILRRQAAVVLPAEIQSQKVQRLISDMKQILRETPDGVGLAAPQVGAPLRLFIISGEAAVIGRQVNKENGDNGANRVKGEWEYFVFINPVLKKASRKKIEMAEGCLSLPGKYGLVPRAEKVSLAWLDEEGRKHDRGFTRFFARVIQHELDHLAGRLLSDRAKKLVSISAQRPATE